MSRTARNIVEAIQHSLLGSLVVALAWWAWLVGQMLWIFRDRAFGLVPLIAMAAFVALWALAWLLGSLARPAYPTGSPFDGVGAGAAPENGFDVWRRVPAGGLRPPRAMRRLVQTLGRSPDRKGSVLFELIVIVPLAGFFALLAVPDDWWAMAHPWLGWPENRSELAAFALLVLLFVAIRGWASQERAKLAPLDD